MNYFSFQNASERTVNVATTLVSNTLPPDDKLVLIIDIANTYMVPAISFFGMITNIMTIIVFSHAEFNDLIYKYLYVNAFSNFVYLLICFFLFAPRCGQLCDFSTTRITQYYYFIFYTYLKGIPAILSINIQITVSLYKYVQITNKTFFKFKYFKLTIVILILFSAVFYLPILLTKSLKVVIKPTSNNLTITTYSMIANDFGNSMIGKLLIIIVSVIRGFVSLIILTIINVLTKFEFSKFLKRKKQITTQEEAECMFKKMCLTRSFPSYQGFPS